jgi:aspartyl-tRNA(Asn)/glutamyl-tRNA(Gln) amidotransferase subunit C
MRRLSNDFLRHGCVVPCSLLCARFTLLSMALTSEDVLHIARLARISLTEDDVQRFTAQLSGILDHFTALSAVDTEGLDPTAHPLPLSNVMRDDEVASSLSQEDALANAPRTEEGYVRVRAVLE